MDFLWRNGSDCGEHVLIFQSMFIVILVISIGLLIVSSYMICTSTSPSLQQQQLVGGNIRRDGCCYQLPFPVWYHPWRLRVFIALGSMSSIVLASLRLWNDQRIGRHWGITMSWNIVNYMFVTAAADTVWHSARLDLSLLAQSAEHANERMIMFGRMTIGSRISAVLFVLSNTAILISVGLPDYQYQWLIIYLVGTGLGVAILGGFLVQYLSSLISQLKRHRVRHVDVSISEIKPLIARLQLNRSVIGQLIVATPLSYWTFACWPYLTVKSSWLFIFTNPQLLIVGALLLWLHRSSASSNKIVPLSLPGPTLGTTPSHGTPRGTTMIGGTTPINVSRPGTGMGARFQTALLLPTPSIAIGMNIISPRGEAFVTLEPAAG
jgi:hypothetical protein